ncbi:MAG: 4'-phosphopantetheinyl transferase superfamily protein [Sulfurovum sp.]
MIEIYLIHIDSMDEEEYQKYLSIIPLEMQKEVLRYRQRDDRYRTLIGKKTLFLYLKDKNISLNDIKRDTYNRPYLNNSDIEFNISHSNEYIVSVFTSYNSIGIDIEEINNNIDIYEFRDVFREEEFNQLISSLNPIELFYRLWTIKEAVLKAIGRGFIDNPKDVIIGENIASYKDKSYNILTFKQDKYICSLAFEKKAKVVIRTEIC